MKLEISEKGKVRQLITIFRNLKNIACDMNIHFSKDGIYIQGMEASHSCLIEINIEGSWFDVFDTTDGVVGVNCDLLSKLIDCWKEGQKIVLYSDDFNTISIDFEGENTLTKRFEIPSMDIDCEIMEIPDKEYEADLSLKSTDFKELIGELSLFNDELQFICNEDDVILKAKGDMGSATVEIKNSDIEEYAVEDGLSLSISYSIKFINAVCAFNKLNTYINIHASKDTPLKLNYYLNDTESKNFVRFFIAPKIEY